MAVNHPDIIQFTQLKELLWQQIKEMRELLADSKDLKAIYRIEIDCDSLDILPWLQSQKFETKLFWSDRNAQQEAAGLGVAKKYFSKDSKSLENSLNEMKSLCRTSKQARFYGGLSFDQEDVKGNWEAFGSYQFILPRFELIQSKFSSCFACNLFWEDISKDHFNQILAELDLVDFDTKLSEEIFSKPSQRKDFPRQEDWSECFDLAQKTLNSESFEKIVLARKSVFQSKTDVPVFNLKKKLKALAPECFQFCFQPAKDIGFIGASPERLFKRQNQKIESEAIAGTRPRKKDFIENEALKSQLLTSKKELCEHQLVVDSINLIFKNLCSEFKKEGSPHVLELSGAYHLKTDFSGILNELITDFDLLKVLHPTPAVSGFPSKESMKVIKEIEPFSRGWYAGLFGYVSDETTEFCVAIRSGLIEKKQISLFAGAGILKESDQTQEWNEIEHKMNQFFQVFQ